MIAFIDAHRDQFGVELICRVLRAAIPGFLTARGYRAARVRPASDREIRDEQLIADLRTVHKDNFSVYGVKKMHAAMKRRGWHLGREQTRRLMHKAGLRGVQRGKPIFTTVTDPADSRPADLVNRQFIAAAPNRLWVADITYVRTWQGFCYTAFVTDVCTRKIVGWAVSTTMRTEDLPLQAFNHAVWQSNSDLSELIHHSDRGSQGGFNWSSQHLDHGGVVWPSVRTRNRLVGDGSGRLTVRCGLRCAHQGARTRRGRCSVSFGG
ncbi:IS3 family transposase [Mycolicibacterium fortuitum]|uniref:IS3 family transposase n=2 Tax=Mycolicibacterium fortuitum TaxID=1766 RepID=UPI0011322C3E|nr:IS3 family transposase [Mycolicibacterium fortuitum]MDG5784245.1 IS3 family transposase [Mycolicibacterium fortuitum]TPW92949.1 IS3 family transposase [Mycolicibacterium fortuitum]